MYVRAACTGERLKLQAGRAAACCAVAGACLFFVSTAEAAFKWVSIQNAPGFRDAEAQMQALVDKNGRQAINDFCVIGQKDGAHVQAQVYWKTEKKLILWVPDMNDPETLVHSRRYLDLERDVRANVGTSTYLLSRSFVAELLQACAAKGDQFIIRRAPAPVATRG